ncbi:MAG TPA: hypothetical protein VK083_20630 [Nocardia sp.]|uniref:hypothetical protein n=1 Tax=Nocardia sp. TaxID=1821 RepID=UPI002B4B1D24|nr:hypothetical protein [Nocardia sp.]HLS79193.1 hypothetical protein [Nocardia sp.]
MRIKSFAAAAALAVATVAGVSTAATANAVAPIESTTYEATTYEAAYYEGTYIGTYATLAACRADGESPSTGGWYWECYETWNGYDLYIYY